MIRAPDGKVIFDDQDKKILIDLVNRRFSIKGIQRHFGIGEKPAVRILAELGLKTNASKAICLQEERWIVEMLTKGASVAQIREQIKFKERDIAYIARKHNVPGWGRTNEIAEETKDALVTGYEQLKNYQKVCDSLGLTHAEGRSILKQRGIRIVVRYPTPEIDALVIEQMKTSNGSCLEMAKKVGISYSGFRSVCKRLGLKRSIPMPPPPPRHRGPMLETLIRKYGDIEGRERYSVCIAKISKRSSGHNNPMFGKPSPQGAGNGWKGWYKGHYFRSLREAMWMIEMDEKGVEWVSGESLSIPYMFNGKKRTYRPDFLLKDSVVEIKPTRLHRSPSILAKCTAGRQYCEKMGLTYLITDVVIHPLWILSALDKHEIRFDRDYEQRFRAYINRHLVSASAESLAKLSQ